MYRKVAGSQHELWEEYYKLRREVKNLVLEKKRDIWNEVLIRTMMGIERSSGLL